MSFEARYAGECADCGEPIAVGDRIARLADGPGYVHVACPEPWTSRELRPICPRCRAEQSAAGTCLCPDNR